MQDVLNTRAYPHRILFIKPSANNLHAFSAYEILIILFDEILKKTQVGMMLDELVNYFSNI